jgi:hypothetical protein
MIIRGHSGQDIRRMIWRRKSKLLTVAVLIIVAVTLMGCGTVNKKGSAVSEFWKALGSGDITVLKKLKGVKDKEDGSWDTIDLATKAK